MVDIVIEYTGVTGPEVNIVNGDLDKDEDLRTAVYISLFSWRKANLDDPYDPKVIGGRKGWWYDTFSEVEGDRFGSRLWLLEREKVTEETLNRLEEYAEEALQWMIEDGVADSLDITTERITDLNELTGLTAVGLKVVVEQPTGEFITVDISNVWEQLSPTRE